VMSFTALMTAFYMFRLLWVTFLTPSRMTHEAEHHVHESPFSMTSVLVVLAVLSAIGGFLSIPHFLEPLLPMPKAQESLEHYETTLIVLSVVLALLGLAGAVLVYRGGLARAESLAARFPRLHRLLSGKYFIDELYDAVLNRPLLWISDRVFLGVGDRFLIDGSLNGMAALAERAAGRLSRVETGNLQFYVVLAVLGVIACLGWMWSYG
jgi:NADH-quinone oxidoreductase subunit L